MSERDERHASMMLDLLRRVRARRCSLVTAVDRLLALLNEIEDLEPSVATRVTDLLLTMESAGTHSRRGVLPPGESLNRNGEIHKDGLSPMVLDALDQLERLVRRLGGSI